MNAVSLFSGVGGFEIGFERAGIKTVLQAEKNTWCLNVLSRHWPDIERVNDVREVTREYSEPDIVYGGFPCQDLSGAKKQRDGLSGDRSGLWFEFNRVLRELRPRWAVIENVPGVLSSDKGRDFGIILQGLEECGFGGISWAILDAQYFGVPQRRRRVFIIAGPTRRSTESVLCICESCSGGDKEISKQKSIASRGIETSTRKYISSGEYTYIPKVAYPIAAREAKGVNKVESQTNFIAYKDKARRLTPTECERLMSWPDDWTKFTDDGMKIADEHRFPMIGNGVVCNVSEWIGKRIIRVD